MKTRQTALNDYNRFKIRLESKKDKLWLSSEPSKWELAPNLKITRQELLQNKLMAYKQMCFKENEVEIGLRNTFGYLNEQTMKEVSMGLELKAFGYIIFIKIKSPLF